jgi:hypothetical protein
MAYYARQRFFSLKFLGSSLLNVAPEDILKIQYVKNDLRHCKYKSVNIVQQNGKHGSTGYQ